MRALIETTLQECAGGGSLDLAPRRFGRVVACDGGLIEVSGLGVPIGTLCTIAQGRGVEHRAETIGFRNGHTMMMMLGDTVLLRPGAVVRPEANPGMLSVGEDFLGRSVDGAGRPIDGKGPIGTGVPWPAGGYRVDALDRSSVTEPLDVGIRSLNALTTFGEGQRIGIMAGSGVGKSVLMDMIVHGADADAIVVGLIGERAREVSDFVNRYMGGERAGRTAIVACAARCWRPASPSICDRRASACSLYWTVSPAWPTPRARSASCWANRGRRAGIPHRPFPPLPS